MSLDVPYGQFAQRVLTHLYQKLPPARRPAALVTGFCSALDLALAEAFADHGYDIVLCSNDRGRLLAATHTLRGRYPDVRIEKILIDDADTAACDKLRSAVDELGLRVRVVLANVHPVLTSATPFAPSFTTLLGEVAKRGKGRLLVSASVDANDAEAADVDPAAAFDVAMGLWKMWEGQGLAVSSLLVGAVTAGSEATRLANSAYQSLTFGDPRVFTSVTAIQDVMAMPAVEAA